MPVLTQEEVLELIKSIEENAIPLSVRFNSQEEVKSLRQCDEYLNGINCNINDMSPLAVYYIISKLSSDEQIFFIKNNIDFIKKNEKDIFLYTLVSPRSLSYFFNLDVLRELKKIDNDIFINIISSNPENLFFGFRHEDYLSFYNEFYKDLNEIKNNEFVNGIYFHNRCCYDNKDGYDINTVFDIQRKYNKEFIIFLLDKYKDKINNLENRELLYFIHYIEDIDLYKKFINDNHEKINNAFLNINQYDLEEYLSETDGEKQEILISNFFDKIIKKQNIKKIIYKINPKIVLELYKNNKDLFNELTLNDWIKFSSKNRLFNEEIKNILDSFSINNIEELFDTNFYASLYYKEDVSALKYIELKYRSNCSFRSSILDVDINTSIFSDKFISNLNVLKDMFNNNIINRSSDVYKKHLTCFVLYLKKQNIITDVDNYFNEIEKLFYKIVMGRSITIVYELTNIEDITLFNRLGKLDFKADCFTVDQLKRFNVKYHKQLCTRFENNDWHVQSYKKLILKLMLLIGFDNSKKLLDIDSDLPVLEHLVGNVDVKNIKLDNNGNPILNSKIINLLFSDFSRITEMLKDKDNDLYKYFPRIFNEWEMIKLNEKDKSLKIILDYLKSDDISLPPKYYRLKGLFKDIGCGNNIVTETLLLHDLVLKRNSSTIPRVSGNYNLYTYEMLRLDDLESLAVGNKTDCCFTVLGNGYSCLRHAVTSTNGRVFVVKKDGEIIAHSWVWRNGDLLCFDNIEISKKISCVDFFDLYTQAVDEVINTSFTCEGLDCIKNVTIGFTNFDKVIKGIEKYPCLINKKCDLKEKDFESRLGLNRRYFDELPKPIEEVSYSDSKNVQYLIRGNGKFKLGQSNYLYQDDRHSVLHYNRDLDYDDNYLEEIIKRINALRYIKLELEDKLDKYKNIELDIVKEIYCNDDWYYLEYLDGSSELFNNSLDDRSKDEIDRSLKLTKKIIKK